jgi:hypothetical protein
MVEQGGRLDPRQLASNGGKGLIEEGKRRLDPNSIDLNKGAEKAKESIERHMQKFNDD